jgi:peptide/nickel transport system ATP-binding protein
MGHRHRVCHLVPVTLFVVPPLLEIRNLAVYFGTASAVRDVSFSLAAGETLGLVGESGSGKSVTSLAIMGLLPPQARAKGSIVFDGADLLRLSPDAMRSIRGVRIAMIFQEPMTALNPVMRIGDQIAEAVLNSNKRSALVGGPLSHDRPERLSKAQAWQRANEALREVAMPDPERRARDYPHQLSGGQRQRVMIAMAIVNRPHLLIADEPTTALDVTIQAQILALLADLRHRFKLAMLFISHDLAVVSQVSDRIAVMYAGSIVEMAPARDVFCAPAHPYTRGLLKSVPTLATDRSEPLRTIEGTVPGTGSSPPGCPFEPRCDWRVASCAAALPPLVETAPGHLVRCPFSGSG